MANLNVNEARKQLVNALGESSKSYFAHLKSWFCMKMTKEDFDRQARLLLPPSRVHLHNEFLLAVLTKCQSLCQPADLVRKPKIQLATPLQEEVEQEQHIVQQKVSQMHVDPDTEAKPSVKVRLLKARRKSIRVNYETRFQPVEPIQMPLPAARLDFEKPRAGFCVRDNTLPDIAMIHGRILLAAWDAELEQGCDNDSVELLLSATQLFLKRLLAAMITTRKGYKVREKKFIHSVGQSSINPWIHNSWNFHDRTGDSYATEVSKFNTDVNYIPALRLPYKKTEREAAYNVACTDTSTGLEAITAKDLFLALQVKKNIIPCHTVYAVNMERISARLYHSDE